MSTVLNGFEGLDGNGKRGMTIRAGVKGADQPIMSEIRAYRQHLDGTCSEAS